MSERRLLEAALAHLDEAALAVKSGAATEEEQHQILGCLVGAYSLLGALSRVDPAAVDELLQRAIQLRARVSRPKSGTIEVGESDAASGPRAVRVLDCHGEKYAKHHDRSVPGSPPRFDWPWRRSASGA